MTQAITDVELLNQHRNGSESAFADLVGRHLGWVYGLARRRLRDAHLADDVAQAVFILLHRKAPEFAADGAMIRWLYRTAWYASESAARSKRRRMGREIQYAAERPEAVEPAEPPEWKELAPVLDQLIGKLSRSDREAILLRYYRDLSPAEIAQQIGTTPEAARKRIERAVERLRTLAGERGVALSSASLAAGLTHFVRIPPPPGLLATSTVAATAAPGSAMAASSASIVKGTILMTTGTKVAVGSVAVLAVCVALAAIGGSIWILAGEHVQGSAPAATASFVATTSPPAEPFAAVDSAAKIAPFSGIRWRGDAPEAQVNGSWYELRAIDGVAVDEIFNSQKANNDSDWRKHFGEDLPEVMSQLHHPLGPAIALQVRALDGTGTTSTLSGVPMTESNRQALMVWPARGQSTLFADLRWTNGAPQVQIAGTWYELLGVQGESAAHLINSAKENYGYDWQNQFQKNLMEVIARQGKEAVYTADLQLRTLDSSEQVMMTIRVPQPAAASTADTATDRQYGASNSFEKAAPFSAIRWRGDVPQVEVSGIWYQLLAVDGLTVEEIHASQNAHGDWNWRKHFGEDLVEVLTAMGHTPGDTVELKVESLDGKETKTTLRACAMTEENRQAVMEYPSGGRP